MSQVCELCEKEVSKYCCPRCAKRTCSLQCVKDHKIKYACDGLKGIPTAPEAADGPEKYTEALFVKDYNFLENVSSYADRLERERAQTNLGEDKSVPVDEGRRRKVLEFKKMQKVGKLAELRLLPSEFSRSKKNRTHLVGATIVETATEHCEDEPEKKSSRRGKICWTLDLVEYDNGRLIETVFEVSDDTLLRDLIRDAKRVFLKNETRSREVEKWKEIKESDWHKPLSQVLIGAHVFEYPIFAIEREQVVDKELEKKT